MVNSPRAIERSVDKFYTTALLQEAGIPMPETVGLRACARTPSRMLAMGDVVIKPIFGSMGHGMVRVSDPDMAFRVCSRSNRCGAVFYVQRAIDHDGRDVRVFVIGGRVVGSDRATAPEGDWRTNVARGRYRAGPSTAAWQARVRATAAVGADYAGVDLLPSRDGRVSCWKSTAFLAGRGCSRRRASTSLRHRRVSCGTPGRNRTSPACGALALIPATRGGRRQDAAEVAAAAQLACMLEARAPKPGNVSPGRSFADLAYEDSRQPPGDRRATRRRRQRPLGDTIRLAVEATQRWTPSTQSRDHLCSWRHWHARRFEHGA